VYGQVYQTGADAYENYVLWALLILPWVIIGRFGALWMLWLTVSNVALILLWTQVEVGDDFQFELGLFPLLATLNGLALAGREHGASRDWNWLRGRWLRQVIWFSILFYLTIPALVLIIDIDRDFGALVGTAGLAAALLGGHVYFRRIAPDLLSLGFNALSFCVVLLTLIGKLLLEASEEAPAFLLFGLIVLGISSAAALYLRHLARTIGDEATR
jgi:uncharacterized membrane protein